MSLCDKIVSINNIPAFNTGSIAASETQFTWGPLEAVSGCGLAALGIPLKIFEKCPHAYINMKRRVMSRNCGVHETSVS